MHFEIINLKPKVARKLAVGHKCPTASFLATVVSSNYFTKSHDFSVIIQSFKFHDFSLQGTFFSDFPGFQ